MGERECYEKECCRDRFDDCCDNSCGGSGNIIWILIILYLLFCNGNNSRGGGLFGGLF